MEGIAGKNDDGGRGKKEMEISFLSLPFFFLHFLWLFHFSIPPFPFIATQCEKREGFNIHLQWFMRKRTLCSWDQYVTVLQSLYDKGFVHAPCPWFFEKLNLQWINLQSYMHLSQSEFVNLLKAQRPCMYCVVLFSLYWAYWITKCAMHLHALPRQLIKLPNVKCAHSHTRLIWTTAAMARWILRSPQLIIEFVSSESFDSFHQWWIDGILFSCH